MLLEGAARLGTPLEKTQLEQFEIYAELLQLWGRKINLTTRLSDEEIVVYHFLDSLAGLQVTGTSLRGTCADIGTGAGFPGIPLKIALPGIHLTLVESSHKKTSFCREVARRTGLDDVAFFQGRAEHLSMKENGPRGFDWVVTRAFRSAADTLKLASPLLSPEGSLLLYKGYPGRSEVRSLKEAAAGIGLAVTVHSITVPYLEATRTILLAGAAARRGG
jgi:16S rRNA (guanine527-N7)-methyltransferase